MKMRVRATCSLIMLAVIAHSNTLADTNAGFRLALPGHKYSFPRDHASHPNFRTEWWYYTGHLQAGNGRRFGYELTFFRNALILRLTGRTSKWATRDVVVAHFAVTDETTGKFYCTDRISRAAQGIAGAATDKPHVWLGAWDLKFFGKNGAMQTLKAEATNLPKEIAIDLQQRALKPPVQHGTNGVSQKAAGRGRASHYYSYTRLATTGTLRVGNETFRVQGQSWFDHEFGSNQLSSDEAGWDWFSLQLDDGRELMLYHLRLKNGGSDPYSSGTLVDVGGKAQHLTLSEFSIEPLAQWHSPHTGADYPARWRVTLPGEGLQFDITPTVADQELTTRRSINITYWEGSVRIAGTARGKPMDGVGYVELTGYDKAFKNTF